MLLKSKLILRIIHYLDYAMHFRLHYMTLYRLVSYFFIILFLSFLSLFSFSQNHNTQANTLSPVVGKIAVLIPNDTPFWLRVNGLAKKAGEDLGVDVSIFKYVSFDGKITETVQQAISEGAQGIIIPNFHNGNIGIG